MDLLSKLTGLDLILEFWIKSSLALGVALILYYILRKNSASLRHFILSFTIIIVMLLPLLSSFDAGWETKLVPSWKKNEINVSITEPWTSSLINPYQVKDKMVLPDKSQANHIVSINSENKAKKIMAPNIFKIPNPIGFIISGLWIFGLFFLLLRIFVGLYGAFKLTQHGEIITRTRFQKILQQLRKVISIKRKIGLLSNEQILVPITWGVIKPVVILPEISSKWTKSQCSSVLYHELSHIKRGDFILKIIARISCAIFWFNPLIWITYNLMKKEQEKACDELVLNSGIKPSTYAANLLAIKQTRHGNWSPPAAVLGAVNKSQLNDRLLAILKNQIKPKEIKMKSKISLAFISFLVIAVIGLARPSDSTEIKRDSYITEDTSFNIAAPLIQEQSVSETQEKKQEKKETEQKSKEKEAQEKKEKKKAIKWVTKDGESGAISIYISDDTEKNIIMDGKIILVDKDGEKKAFSIISDGEQCTIKKDEEGNWTINGEKIKISEEDSIKVLKIGELKDIVIKKEDADVWTIKGDKLELIKDGKYHVLKLDDGHKIVLDGKDVDLKDKKANVFIPHVKKHKSGNKSFTIHLDSNKDKVKTFYVAPHLKVQPYLHLDSEHKELIEKIKKLQEELKKIKVQEGSKEKAEIKAQTLEELTQLLDEMNERLDAKTIKLNDLHISVHPDHDAKAYVHIDKLKTHDDDTVIRIISEDEDFQIIFKSDEFDEEEREKYEKILDKIKDKLKDKYQVEGEIKEEENTFIIKIKGAKFDGDQKTDIKKLMTDIIEEVKKLKDSDKDKKI